MSNEIQYYLGIDGGGTKTAFALVDACGNQIASLTLGASNPNDIGLDATCTLLGDGIDQVTKDIDRAQISLFAGIAGAATGDNAARLTDHLRTLGFAKATCQSDLSLSLAVCLGDADGIAVIMGTGSVSMGRKNGEVFRAGGYGYLFGDVGSGFALGQGAILAALQAEDGSGAPTILREMVAAQCKKDRVLDALASFYAGGKVEVARYAPLVFKAHAQGDAVATEILVRNVRAIADNVRALGSHMGMDEVRVGLCGGLTAESDVILPLLQDALAGDGREYILSVAKAQPIKGALYLAGLR
jgi:N-acetylglucosamine kinase-like BadF-type ATPase